MIRYIVVLALLVHSPVMGLRSVNLTPDLPHQSSGTFSGSAAQAFSNITEIIVEARIHDFDSTQQSTAFYFSMLNLLI